jgi:hypothetical protein
MAQSPTAHLTRGHPCAAPPAAALSPAAKQPGAAAACATTFDGLGPAALAGGTAARASPFGDAPAAPLPNGDPADGPAPTATLAADRSPSGHAQATRVKSFQLQDDDLLALSENAIASSQSDAGLEVGLEQVRSGQGLRRLSSGCPALQLSFLSMLPWCWQDEECRSCIA